MSIILYIFSVGPSHTYSLTYVGRVIAQAVSSWLPTAAAQVQTRV
jgi:hypothetical protein